MFGMRPPFSSQDFLEECRDLIPEKDFTTLSGLPKTEEATLSQIGQPIIKAWIAFDTNLRNELVKVRSSYRHTDPAKYLRPDGYTGIATAHLALEAHKNTSLLEAERFLDQQRWKALEELQAGHFFDLEFIIIYAYQLRILERWEKIRLADKGLLLEEALSS